MRRGEGRFFAVQFSIFPNFLPPLPVDPPVYIEELYQIEEGLNLNVSCNNVVTQVKTEIQVLVKR
mgnify:CR=1 FL=1